MLHWDETHICDIVIMISGAISTLINSFLLGEKKNCNTHEVKGKLSHRLLLVGSLEIYVPVELRMN